MASRRGRRTFSTLAIAAIAAGAILGLLSTWRIYSNDVRLTQAYDIKSALASVLAAITDAETGQRGFLLTGDDAYLQPYRSGTADIRRSLARVESLTQNDRTQRGSVVELHAQVEEKLGELAQTLELRRSVGFEAAQRLVETNVGQQTMDRIRGVVLEMETAENVELARARRESLDGVRLALLVDGSVAAIAIALVTLVLHLLQSHTAELERKVQERTADLEAVNARLEAFALSVAHDLRAPLRGIHGIAQALVDDYGDRLDEIGRDFARRLVTEATSMDALIQDLLAYGRLSHVELAVGIVDLRDVLDASLHVVREDVASADARVTVAPDLPVVSGNRSVLIQVFTNLLSNAIKFGGQSPRIAVWSEHRGRMAHVWVEDQGIGIAPQHQERIFGVFERLHGVESYPGTGIGLAIVRKGDERLGGRVGVESALGHGSRFWIELPEAA